MEEILHQLRLVVYPSSYRVFKPSHVVVLIVISVFWLHLSTKTWRFGASYCGLLGFWARLGHLVGAVWGFPGMTNTTQYMGIISYTIIYKDNQDFPWKVKRLRKFQQWVRKESPERQGCVWFEIFRVVFLMFSLPYKSRWVSWFWRGWLLLSSNSHW